MRSISKHTGVSKGATNALMKRAFTADQSIGGIIAARGTCTGIFTKIIRTHVTATTTGAAKDDGVASIHEVSCCGASYPSLVSVSQLGGNPSISISCLRLASIITGCRMATMPATVFPN